MFMTAGAYRRVGLVHAMEMFSEGYMSRYNFRVCAFFPGTMFGGKSYIHGINIRRFRLLINPLGSSEVEKRSWGMYMVVDE